MNNLAELYRKQGKYEAAEPLLVDALAWGHEYLKALSDDEKSQMW